MFCCSFEIICIIFYDWLINQYVDLYIFEKKEIWLITFVKFIKSILYFYYYG